MSNEKILVPFDLFTPAATAHFEGNLDIPFLKAGPDMYTITGPVVWQADVTNTGDALLVMGTTQATAKTGCARCLDDVTFDLLGEIEGYFLLNQETEAPDDLDDDEFEILPNDKTIDIESLVIAALLLEVPLVPLCDDECKGLCTQCGVNLNTQTCSCTPDTTFEEAQSSQNPFAALKGLSFDDN